MPITYQSTRGGVSGLSFGEAVLMGLPSDRGLLVPSSVPRFDAAKLASMEVSSATIRHGRQWRRGWSPAKALGGGPW
jgi:threonine synthase